MNSKSALLSISIFTVIAATCHNCSSHGIVLHEQMSLSAARSSSALNAFLTDLFGASDSPFVIAPNLSGAKSAHGPIKWLMDGSKAADDGIQTKNHFYEPLSGSGLTDGLDLFGIPSFTWASIRGGGGTAIVNYNSWQNARDYELSSFTIPDKAGRLENLALTMFALGVVIHLNQDLSQPEHTRNDNHLIGLDSSQIEKYGERNYVANKAAWFPLRPRGWTSWRNAGFQKLEDFWDRNLYNGQASALISDAGAMPGAVELGLAEFSNGNFLGGDAIYVEAFKPGDKHYFPFPSLLTSTDFQPDPRATLFLLKDGTSKYSYMLKKIADGITMNNHSRLHYLGKMYPRRGLPVTRVSTTINDPAVLKEYHERLLPKAVEYSAGILDYFSRGRLAVTLSLGRLCVINRSGADLSGGSFRLFYDDSNGNRGEIQPTSTTYTGTLADNGAIQMNFNPVQSAVKYIVVFKGTIGTANQQALDPIDANIAIASGSISVQPGPGFGIARAVSVLSVRAFGIFTFSPLFCGQRWFRNCSVHAVDNGRCGFPLPNLDSAASIPLFASVFTGAFDPCTTTETDVASAPFFASDSSLGCRLSPEFNLFDCWDATFTLSTETLPADLIAACLSNLALIDLDQVPFGSQRKVVNDLFNGSPVFSDSLIATSPPGAAACLSTPPFNYALAASFAFEYTTIGGTRHCTNSRDRRIEMPTQLLIVSATRSRFSANSAWCKCTRGPVFIDPDFAAFCVSRPGACAETACAHYLPAAGVIDVPPVNQSVHIGLCTAPAAPCNPIPIPF